LKPIIIAYNILDKESEMLIQLNDKPLEDDFEDLESMPLQTERSN